MEQLFAPLRKAKLIESIRGAQGGYVLGKEPKDITVADIIYVLEGPIEISDCIDDSTCEKSDYCATRLVWEKIKNSIDEVMKSVTLQEVVDDYKDMMFKQQELKLEVGGK